METTAPRVARPKKPKRHPMLNWVIKAGIASECFGWGALLLAGWFWTATALIYLGFALFAVDVWAEPELRNKMFWRIAGVASVALCAAAFSWGIVLVKAPLDVGAFMTNAEYPAGTVIAGIQWRPEFTEVQVWLGNNTDKNYDDIDVVLRPSMPIAAIGQTSNFPGVSFEDKNGISVRLMDIDLGAGQKATAIPMVLLATDAGYRIRCPHLPAHSTLKITIALADIKWNPRPQQNPPVPLLQQVRDKDYMLRIKQDDFSTYWLGHIDGGVFAPRPTSTDRMKIDGTYYVAQRTRTISKFIDAGGNLTIKTQP